MNGGIFFLPPPHNTSPRSLINSEIRFKIRTAHPGCTDCLGFSIQCKAEVVHSNERHKVLRRHCSLGMVRVVVVLVVIVEVGFRCSDKVNLYETERTDTISITCQFLIDIGVQICCQTGEVSTVTLTGRGISMNRNISKSFTRTCWIIEIFFKWYNTNLITFTVFCNYMLICNIITRKNIDTDTISLDRFFEQVIYLVFFILYRCRPFNLKVCCPRIKGI